MLSNVNSSFISSEKESNWKGYLDENPRHRWYSYKEGFSSKIVERAIFEANVGSNEYVLDPFNGGGTTTLTASSLGTRSVGIEVNPFSKFVSHAKVQEYTRESFLRPLNKIVRSVERGMKSPLSEFSTFTEHGHNSKWLFNSAVLDGFTGGMNIIRSLDGEQYSLFKLALISAAMKNSNAVKDGKCLKYRDNWQSLRFDRMTFLNSFLENVETIGKDLVNAKIIAKPVIIEGDSREVLKECTLPEFKLCITSPPYLNSFDYTDIYRPELFIGEFINSHEELRSLRRKTLRSHVETKLAAPISNEFGHIYTDVISRIQNSGNALWDKQIPTMIQAYFEDMENVLKMVMSRLQHDGQVWIIVSNSAYCGVEIPVDLILANIGVSCGLFLREIGVLRHVPKRKSKTSPNISYLRESAVIFTKTR